MKNYNLTLETTIIKAEEDLRQQLLDFSNTLVELELSVESLKMYDTNSYSNEDINKSNIFEYIVDRTIMIHNRVKNVKKLETNEDILEWTLSYFILLISAISVDDCNGRVVINGNEAFVVVSYLVSLEDQDMLEIKECFIQKLRIEEGLKEALELTVDIDFESVHLIMNQANDAINDNNVKLALDLLGDAKRQLLRLVSLTNIENELAVLKCMKKVKSFDDVLDFISEITCLDIKRNRDLFNEISDELLDIDYDCSVDIPLNDLNDDLITFNITKKVFLDKDENGYDAYIVETR